jgi:DNA-directed RNA polymerase specialized sigma24 family protein
MSRKPSDTCVEELLAQASQGDSRALDSLVEQDLQQLRAFVRVRMDRRLRVREACSDLVQSTWGREAAQPSQISVVQLVRGDESLGSPSQAVVRAEDIPRLETTLDELPEDCREVIAMAQLAGLPHDEIAVQMGRSVGAVRQLLGRALLRLGEPDGGAAPIGTNYFATCCSGMATGETCRWNQRQAFFSLT